MILFARHETKGALVLGVVKRFEDLIIPKLTSDDGTIIRDEHTVALSIFEQSVLPDLVMKGTTEELIGLRIYTVASGAPLSEGSFIGKVTGIFTETPNPFPTEDFHYTSLKASVEYKALSDK